MPAYFFPECAAREYNGFERTRAAMSQKPVLLQLLNCAAVALTLCTHGGHKPPEGQRNSVPCKAAAAGAGCNKHGEGAKVAAFFRSSAYANWSAASPEVLRSRESESASIAPGRRRCKNGPQWQLGFVSPPALRVEWEDQLRVRPYFQVCGDFLIKYRLWQMA